MSPATFTRAHADALERDGYVILVGAIDAASVARLRLAFDGAPAQGDGTQHVALTDATPARDAWDALKEHPAVVAAATQVLEGARFGVRDLHGRNPLPGYGQQGLHADWMPRAAAKPFFVVTAVWMIDDFTGDNGATRVVPGSHLVTKPIAKDLAQPAAHHPREVVVTGKAGSVIVLNGHTWHSGTRNASRGPRRAAQMVIEARR